MSVSARYSATLGPATLPPYKIVVAVAQSGPNSWAMVSRRKAWRSPASDGLHTSALVLVLMAHAGSYTITNGRASRNAENKTVS